MARKSSNMKTWQCPKCKTKIEAMASAVAHRCPSNKNILTAFELKEEE